MALRPDIFSTNSQLPRHGKNGPTCTDYHGNFTNGNQEVEVDVGRRVGGE